MVVVDSSALIPLSWVGRLDLVGECFETPRTTEGVRGEVLVGDKPGTAVIESFLDSVEIHETPAEATSVAELEGIAVTDAGVVLVAAETAEPLLANDKALMQVARAHGVEGWWVTSLVLQCASTGVMTPDEASEVLYDLVDAGMNLDPKVYARIQRRLDAGAE